MPSHSKTTRLVAGTVGLILFGTNCLFAYSAENNIWAERRKARDQRSLLAYSVSALSRVSIQSLGAQFPSPQKIVPSLSQPLVSSVPKKFLVDHAALLASLSPAHGTIRQVSFSSPSSSLSPVVIHIQDVHQNLDAQKNIGHMVGSLVNAQQAGLIALEGTWGEIKLQPFRDFPNRKAVEQSADYLLQENEISGPIHAALIGTGPLPPLVGVDDPDHYNANVDAYRQSVTLLEPIKKDLANQQIILNQEKVRFFSEELKAFDSSVESYRAGRSSLGDYVQALTAPAIHLPIPSSVKRFQKAIVLEKTLNFQHVESERAALINLLVQKLGQPEISELTARSVAYRSGEVSYADFYKFLQSLCSQHGISLQSFPVMNEYVRYVLLADGIDAETLFEDLLSYEKSVYSRLAKTPEMRAVVDKSRSAYLSRQLVDFSLTPQEWKEYRSLPLKETTLFPFENFYREADSRDRSMAENLLKAIQYNKGVRVSILVTGGFHSPGLTAQLTHAGATVIRVVPKIEKLETTQGSTYLSVFAQEKTPLDVLFSGEKLFLAHNPIAPKVSSVDLPAIVATADGGKTGGSLKAVFSSLIPTSVADRIRAMTEKIKNGFSELTIHFNEGWTYHVKANNVSGGALQIKKEILKQSLNPLKLLEEQFFLLPAAVVTMVIASAALIFNIPLLFPVAFVAGLVFLKKAEEPFLKFHPKVNAEILKTSPENYYNFVRLGFWIFGGLTLASLLYGLMGLPAFDVQRVGEVFFKHVFGYGLGYHALFNVLSPIPAMAQISGEKNTTAVVNLMDLGSYPEGNSVDYGDSIAKLGELLVDYAQMGIKELYLTNGLFELSDMGKKVHTSPAKPFHLIQSGDSYSLIGDKPYKTKKTNILGTQLDDRHGSNFSVRDMRILNPKIFRSKTNEGRWDEFAAFVETARQHGIKIRVDLVPWMSPDGITTENWDRAYHHEIVMKRKANQPPLSDDEIKSALQGKPGNSLIRWVEGEDEVWATVSNFGVGIDQIYPNWRHPGYQAYIRESLEKMITAGVESVRVDMAHELGDTQFEFWGLIIENAKTYAKTKNRNFHFLMEAYGDDWIKKFLARFPEEKAYYVDPFHNFEEIAKNNGKGLEYLRASLDYALSKKGQLVVFPTNFDEWSLRDLKGPTHSFLALLLVYEWMGVPLMIDTRELMDEDGQNIPQAGGQDETEKDSERFKHPFRSAVRDGWGAFLNLFRHSPHRSFFEDMRDLLKDAEEIEFLDNTNQLRFVALSVKKKSGDYEIRVLDFYPSWGEVPDFWVEVPKSFLAGIGTPNKEEPEDNWKWRMAGAFVARDPSSPDVEKPLIMKITRHQQKRWYRVPITFGKDKVGRLIIQKASGSVRLHDISSILPILWKPLSVMFLVMTGFVALGFSGAALPLGLSMGMLVLAWDQKWVGPFSKPFNKKPGIQSSTAGSKSQAGYINNQLSGEPASLGVNELQQVWNTAVQEARSEDPTTELWDAQGAQGTPVLFVSEDSVRTEKQQAALGRLIEEGPTDLVVITDAKTPVQDKLPSAQMVLVGPEEFSVMKTSEGQPLGITTVSLAALRETLNRINKNGGNRGLRFHQSLGLQLSKDGLNEKDAYITEAAESTQMLNELFQWGVSVRLLNFPAIIDALRTIAYSA